MLSGVRRKLTYSNVVSTLCLFLVLGGTGAYAATQLAKNSVGAKQLKRGAVTLVKIDPAAQAALKGQRGQVGPAGATGPMGPPVRSARSLPASQGPPARPAPPGSRVVESPDSSAPAWTGTRPSPAPPTS